MRRLLIPLVLAACVAASVVACGSSRGKVDDADEETSDVDTRNKKDSKPVGDNEKGKWSGWRWKGKRGNCYYVHANRCFKRRKAACKAAGCNTDACQLDDSAPAKVSCKNKKKK